MSPRASSAAALRQGAPIFAALGDATRLGIVARLCRGGPASITALTEGSGVTRQAVAKHLRILADAGLVTGVREGRESTWQLLPGKLDAARTALDQIAQQWDMALTRLRALVEKDG